MLLWCLSQEVVNGSSSLSIMSFVIGFFFSHPFLHPPSAVDVAVFLFPWLRVCPQYYGSACNHTDFSCLPVEVISPFPIWCRCIASPFSVYFSYYVFNTKIENRKDFMNLWTHPLLALFEIFLNTQGNKIITSKSSISTLRVNVGV